MPARTRSERQRANAVPQIDNETSSTTGRSQPRPTRKTTASHEEVQLARARSRSTRTPTIQRKASKSPVVHSRKPLHTPRVQPSLRTSRSWVGPFFIFLGILAVLSWSLHAYSDDLCKNHAIKATSSALSRISTIDVCGSIALDGAQCKGFSNDGVGDFISGVLSRFTKDELIDGDAANGNQVELINQVSPGLAVIREAKDIVNQVDDLVELEHDTKLYSKAVLHAWEVLGDLHFDLTIFEDLPKAAPEEQVYADIGHLASTAFQDIKQLENDYMVIHDEIMQCVRLGVQDLRVLGGNFESLVREADERFSWPTWIPNSLKPSKRGVALWARLVKIISEDAPTFYQVYKRSRELVDDLLRIETQLRSIIPKLQKWHEITSDECETWIKKLELSRPTASSSDGSVTASAEEALRAIERFERRRWQDKKDWMMAGRCKPPPLEHIRVINQKITVVTMLIQHLTTTGERTLAIEKSLESLRDMTRKYGRLPFSEKDRELAHQELPQLRADIEAADAKWNDHVLGRLSKGRDQTIKRVGVID